MVLMICAFSLADLVMDYFDAVSQRLIRALRFHVLVPRFLAVTQVYQSFILNLIVSYL